MSLTETPILELLPAVDVADGQAVRLVQGEAGSETSYGVQKWDFDVTQPAMQPPLVTWANHGGPFVAAVENGPLSATQFHPEKSGDAGAALLENWLKGLG